MIKKFLSMMTLICVLVIVLSSCVRETVTLNLEKGGGSILYEQVISKEVYDYLLSMGGETEEIEDQGKTITFFEKDGEEFVKASNTEKFESLAELNAALEKLGDTSGMTSISDKFFEEVYVYLDDEEDKHKYIVLLLCQNFLSLFLRHQ